MSHDREHPARRRQTALSSGHVLLVDGPYNGRHSSVYIARGRLALAEGEYRHVEGEDTMSLYWVPYPVILRCTRNAVPLKDALS